MFTNAIRDVAPHFEIRYGIHRFPQMDQPDRILRGFIGVKLLPEINQAQLIPTHVTIPMASQIVGVSGTAIRNWIGAQRVPDVVYDSPRKTLVPLTEMYRLARFPPQRLEMARTAAPLLTQLGQPVQRDVLRAACFAPAIEWPARVSQIVQDLRGAGDPALFVVIELLSASIALPSRG
jgi:hypothetical protein